MARAILNLRFGSVIALAVLAAGCTMKKQETPSLTGPSELATSITVSVSPDVLTQDGKSQSVISVAARDSNGQPIRNLSLRADVQVNGTTTDFGTLSARNLVTDANGRASVTFTAPKPVAVLQPDGTTLFAPPPDVQIVVRPAESDFGNSTARMATIHLVAPGAVVPPSAGQNGNPTASFVVSPASPVVNQQVNFNASASTATEGRVITSYSWNFGDDSRVESGVTTSHAFSAAGTYTVVLVVTDDIGHVGTTSASVTVITDLPHFTFSPATPTAAAGHLAAVTFDASASVTLNGRPIKSYTWDFGDRSPGATGATVLHSFVPGSTYLVTLTVTDVDNNTATTSQSVIVTLQQ